MPPVICSSFWNEDEKEKEKFYLRSTLKQWTLNQRIIYRLYADFEYKGCELVKGFLGVCPRVRNKEFLCWSEINRELRDICSVDIIPIKILFTNAFKQMFV